MRLVDMFIIKDSSSINFPDGLTGGNFATDADLYYSQIYSMLLKQISD